MIMDRSHFAMISPRLKNATFLVPNPEITRPHQLLPRDIHPFNKQFATTRIQPENVVLSPDEYAQRLRQYEFMNRREYLPMLEIHDDRQASQIAEKRQSNKSNQMYSYDEMMRFNKPRKLQNTTRSNWGISDRERILLNARYENELIAKRDMFKNGNSNSLQENKLYPPELDFHKIPPELEITKPRFEPPSLMYSDEHKYFKKNLVHELSNENTMHEQFIEMANKIKSLEFIINEKEKQIKEMHFTIQLLMSKNRDKKNFNFERNEANFSAFQTGYKALPSSAYKQNGGLQDCNAPNDSNNNKTIMNSKEVSSYISAKENGTAEIQIIVKDRDKTKKRLVKAKNPSVELKDIVIKKTNKQVFQLSNNTNGTDKIVTPPVAPSIERKTNEASIIDNPNNENMKATIDSLEHHNNIQDRLSQDLPGYNWLEERVKKASKIPNHKQDNETKHNFTRDLSHTQSDVDEGVFKILSVVSLRNAIDTKLPKALPKRDDKTDFQIEKSVGHITAESGKPTENVTNEANSLLYQILTRTKNNKTKSDETPELQVKPCKIKTQKRTQLSNKKIESRKTSLSVPPTLGKTRNKALLRRTKSFDNTVYVINQNETEGANIKNKDISDLLDKNTLNTNKAVTNKMIDTSEGASIWRLPEKTTKPVMTDVTKTIIKPLPLNMTTSTEKNNENLIDPFPTKDNISSQRKPPPIKPKDSANNYVETNKKMNPVHKFNELGLTNRPFKESPHLHKEQVCHESVVDKNIRRDKLVYSENSVTDPPKLKVHELPGEDSYRELFLKHQEWMKQNGRSQHSNNLKLISIQDVNEEKNIPDMHFLRECKIREMEAKFIAPIPIEAQHAYISQKIPRTRDGSLDFDKSKQIFYGFTPKGIFSNEDYPAHNLISTQTESIGAFRPPLKRAMFQQFTGNGPSKISKLHKDEQQQFFHDDYFKKLPEDSNKPHLPEMNYNKKDKTCKICDKPAPFLCSGCKTTWYCSKSCQLFEWKSHIKECSGTE